MNLNIFSILLLQLMTAGGWLYRKSGTKDEGTMAVDTAGHSPFYQRLAEAFGANLLSEAEGMAEDGLLMACPIHNLGSLHKQGWIPSDSGVDQVWGLFESLMTADRPNISLPLSLMSKRQHEILLSEVGYVLTVDDRGNMKYVMSESAKADPSKPWATTGYHRPWIAPAIQSEGAGIHNLRIAVETALCRLNPNERKLVVTGFCKSERERAHSKIESMLQRALEPAEDATLGAPISEMVRS